MKPPLAAGPRNSLIGLIILPPGMGMHSHLAGTYLGEEDAERGQRFVTHLQDVYERRDQVIALAGSKPKATTIDALTRHRCCQAMAL